MYDGYVSSQEIGELREKEGRSQSGGEYFLGQNFGFGCGWHAFQNFGIDRRVTLSASGRHDQVRIR